MKYEILGSKTIASGIHNGRDWKTKVELIFELEDKTPMLRYIWYQKMRNDQGTEYWNLAPRPATFELHKTEEILQATKELKTLWDKTVSMVKSQKVK